MKIKDIEIGASESAAPLGLDPWMSPAAFYARKLSIDADHEDNAATRLGRHFEAAVVSEFEERHDVRVSPTRTLYSKIDPWWRVTPDRIIETSGMSQQFMDTFDVFPGETVGLEVKTTGLASYQPQRMIEQKWGAPMTDEVPANYFVQTQAQGRVMREHFDEVHKVILPALIPSRAVVDYVIRVDEQMHRRIRENLLAFINNHLVPEICPAPETEDDWNVYAKIVTRPYFGDEEKKTTVEVQFDSVEAQMMMEFEKARQDAEEALTRKAMLRARLIEVIGEGWKLVLPGFGQVTLSAPKEKQTVSFAPAQFGKGAIEIIEAEHKREPTPLTTRLMDLARQHTKPRVTGRTLKLLKEMNK